MATELNGRALIITVGSQMATDPLKNVVIRSSALSVKGHCDNARPL